jgi:hypothetical protein
MAEIIPIKLKTQSINRREINISLNGFILNYMNRNHLITIHHNLPVNSLYYNDCSEFSQEKIEIIRNSGWSEILIGSTETLNLEEYKINKLIKNAIPKKNQSLTLKSTENYEMRVIDYDFLPFDNIHSESPIPYIKAEFIRCVDKVQGLSGSPVFIDNKLIGIFSKYNVRQNVAYIIPIYLVIKNLEKIDFVNIYCSPTIDINKINSYNVKENMIYHPSLKINVPVATYFILEGDINSRFIIQTKSGFKSYDSLAIINIEIDIVNRNEEYKINPRLLTLINKFNISKQIIIQLLNNNDKWFTMNENNITLVR